LAVALLLAVVIFNVIVDIMSWVPQSIIF